MCGWSGRPGGPSPATAGRWLKASGKPPPRLRRARAFLTVGGGEIAAFFARADTALLARMIEPPEEAPPHLEILLARPPFTLEGELALLKERGIDVVVCKNSGGEATRAKLDAARELGLLVIMVARPEKPDAPCAATPEGLRDLVLKLI